MKKLPNASPIPQNFLAFRCHWTKNNKVPALDWKETSSLFVKCNMHPIGFGFFYASCGFESFPVAYFLGAVSSRPQFRDGSSRVFLLQFPELLNKRDGRVVSGQVTVGTWSVFVLKNEFLVSRKVACVGWDRLWYLLARWCFIEWLIHQKLRLDFRQEFQIWSLLEICKRL